LVATIDKGLVIITGCSHAARLKEISSHALNLLRDPEVDTNSDNQIHALVGGFHMEEAEQEELQAAVRDLREIKPDYLLAGNCTGLRFQLEVEESLPNTFVRCFCGGEYIF
jgi:7,8-dihydropterin-6-yl-methyl-4-(beta-D-ribofuranosyl)aminobenzene 5'-phosphate synthase